MNYKQLDQNKKAQIDILLENEYPLREAARILGISHSTISRYKNGIYQKRQLNIHEKYKDFLDYLYRTYDWRVCPIEICVHNFKKYYPYKPCVSYQQVYNWINQGKINITVKETCYKRH
ncbi:MAG: helix-turn-helix domain-containing protein, partial [Coprobacillus sp.]